MSRIECGSLTQVGRDGVEYRGEVQLGDRLDGVLILKKHRRAGASDDHPDFVIEYAPRNGSPRPIGAGWLKNGDRVGDFITMTLDDPDWPSPLNLSAFPPTTSRGETSWAVVWSRPRGVRVQDRPASPQGASHAD